MDFGLFIITVVLLVLKWILFVFLNGISFSEDAVIVYSGFLVIFSSFFCLIREKRGLFFLIINGILSLLLFANSIYMDYFGTPISAYTLLQVGNLNGLGGSVRALIRPVQFLYFIDFPFYIYFYHRMPPSEGEGERMVPWFFRLLAMGLVLLLIPFVSDYFQKGTRGVSLHEGTDYIARYSLIGYQIADVASLLQEGQTVLAAEEKDEIAEWFKEKNREPRIDRDLSLYGFGKEKNLIVIQVESLQNFVIGREVNGQEITPNLNRLLKHSIYFPSFYPQTIEGNSSDAEFLTQVSLYPLEKGSVYYLYPDHRYFSLGEWMKSRGYRTVAIHADDASYWNRDDVYPNLGFDDYLSIDDFEVDEEIGMGLGDLSMFRQAAKFLSEMKEPFYSFLITLTNHTPFDLPEEYRKLNLQGELDESILGGYLQSVHYTDRAIGKFLEDLDRQGLLKNSVVAIYGDHDGIFEKEKGLVEKYLSHGEINDEEWIQTYVPVPLIIYNPGLEGEVIDKVGGQIDFLPTIGQIMGFNENMLYFSMGDNLFLSKKGAAIIPKGDYSQKPSYVVTDRGIRENLNEEEQKVLEISNLIIKGDYFREMEK